MHEGDQLEVIIPAWPARIFYLELVKELNDSLFAFHQRIRNLMPADSSPGPKPI